MPVVILFAPNDYGNSEISDLKYILEQAGFAVIKEVNALEQFFNRFENLVILIQNLVFN